jgi:hypothetical protein
MANVPISNLTTTWNNVSTTFTGIKLNVTDAASTAGSLLIDLQVGGASQFNVSKAGAVTLPNGTANGVAFLNASKVLTTGSALTFDGTNLGIGTSSPDANLTVNGAASFAAGTALLPSIARAGDLNTGIFFPAADTIAFAEGGAEAMRIDASGNLLVGTTTNTNSSRLVVNGTISETVGGVQYQVVSQADIGTAPNEIPLTQYLGELAYMNAEAVVIQPQAFVTPNGIGDMVFQLTSNTSLVIKVKGSDGTVRSATLTLA